MIYYDGTYAVLMGYKEPEDKKVMQECANIEFISLDIDWDTDEITLVGGYVYPAITVGSNVRYQLLHIEPAGTVTGDLTAPGVVIINFDPGFGDVMSYVEFPEGTLLTSTVSWENTFIVRFYFANCYEDFNWPGDFR